MPAGFLWAGSRPCRRLLLAGSALLCLITWPAQTYGQVWGSGAGGSIYYDGGNVGIGTTNPSNPLTVSSNGANALAVTGSSTNSIGLIISNAAASGRSFSLYSSGGGPAAAGSFGIYDNSAGTRFVIDSAGNVGIGTTNPQYRLAVNGNIGAQDLIVTNNGWSDYVFRSGYRLRPLSEVSAFIQKHHHLPDIPTEAEVKEKGVSLGDMQAKLLAKVEELTLHLIQQEEENKELRERVTQLEDRVAANSGTPSDR